MNLTSQIADHILRCFFNALLHRTGGNLRDGDVRFNDLTVIDEQQRANRDVDFLRPTLTRGLNREREINFCLLSFNTMGGAVGPHARLAAELNVSGNFGSNNTTFSGRHTSGVERPHRELRSRLTNGLGGDDANRFTQINQFVMGQGPAVTLAADGTICFTRERRTNTDRRDTCLLDCSGKGRIDFGIALSQYLTISVHHLCSR